MTFEEILDQAIEMLQRRGRLTYRALKLQFNLDDEYLDALKDELIEGQRLAVDENSRVLVWAGGLEATPASASQPAPASVSQPIQQDQPTQAETPPPEPPAPDAERRQLTVMFCDLADSTRLSGQLDPEDLRDVIRAYQSACAEVIERYDGYIAQHLGDGLMVYFGWPQAHEDDAQRAVHAGLGILEAIQTLNTQLEQDKGIRLTVRIGIHTGLVVVGEIGQGASQEHLALGETPNVASRIERLAAPDTVAISDATYQLMQGYFSCEAIGLHTLKGVDKPQQVYRVAGASGAQSRLDLVSAHGLTPLVGREQETGLLVERWEQVKTGQGQVVLLSGEAGIGKSRLLQVLRDHVDEEPHSRLECRSSPYYQNTALYPITDMLQRVLIGNQDDTTEAKLDTLEQTLRAYRLALDEAMPLFANLLSLTIPEDRYSPLNLSPQRQRQKTLETIVAMLLQQAEKQPVLFILEDLHWTDPSTLEFLDLLLDQVPTAAICVLLTCRPAFQPHWTARSYLSQVTLNRLSQTQIENMAEQVAGGKRLPAEVMQQIVEKTDGVPLFVEEMTKAVMETGALKQVNGQYETAKSLTSLAIPATLQDSLMARLDRLVTAKAVAQYAAVIGRQFSYQVLRAVSQLDNATLQRELARLVEAELVYQRGVLPHATYTFKHALVVEAAYASLLKGTRQQYHQRIAQVLEAEFPETAENQPELLAHHYTEAGVCEQAIGYWKQAGEKAKQRFAYTEAIAHLTKGLEALPELPDTPERTSHELALNLGLGEALQVTKGYGVPEVVQVYDRVRALSAQVEDRDERFRILWGLFSMHASRGEARTVLEIGEQMVNLTQNDPDIRRRMVAHRAVVTASFQLCDFARGLVHADQVRALHQAQPQRFPLAGTRQDPVMACLSTGAIALWFLGYADQAQQRSNEALTWARELAHPFSLVFALVAAARFHLRLHEGAIAHELAEEAIALATQHHFEEQIERGKQVNNCVLMMQGRVAECLEPMREYLDYLRRKERKVDQPSAMLYLAMAYVKSGEIDTGLRLVSEGLALIDALEMRRFEAEAHWLRGELLLMADGGWQHDALTPEDCFKKALDIARQQQAKSWELRAATSLARLWQSQGKRQEAYDLLQPMYDWFTEGFDTADLQEAKSLLQELG